MAVGERTEAREEDRAGLTPRTRLSRSDDKLDLHRDGVRNTIAMLRNLNRSELSGERVAKGRRLTSCSGFLL